MVKRPMRISVWFLAVTVAAVSAGGVLGFRRAGGLQRLELVAYDHHMRLAARDRQVESHAALLEVTETDIQRIGSYPVPDATLLQAIEALDAAGARVVGVDIYRDIPEPPGSEELTALLEETDLVVWVSKFADETTPGVGPPPALAGTQQVGFNNMVVDPSDGVVRRGLLFMDDAAGETALSFPLLLAWFYLQADGVGITPSEADPALVDLGPTTVPKLDAWGGGFAGVDADGYQMLVDCRATPQSLPSATLHDLLEGRADPAIFRDRIAVLGLTADSIPDRFHVPCVREHSVAGAAVHAELANQLVRFGLGEGAPVRTLSERHENLAVMLLAALGVVIALVTRSTWQFALAGAAGLALLWGIGWKGLELGWWLPVVPSGLAGVVSASVVTAYVSSRERRERAEVMSLFSRMVDDKVAAEVWRRRDEYLEGGRPKPERVTVSVLFVDMKGYTSRAEKLEPDELMVWLDAYLRDLSQCILDAGGFVVDYFGDGIMACFGLPIPAEDEDGVRRNVANAAACGLAMQEAVGRLNREWSQQGMPPIGLRVGIATGVAVAGSIGSAQRMKYGAVGDVVNTAQRLESLDDSHHDFVREPCRILVGASTRERLGEDFHVVEAGHFKLKGKAEAVVVYRVLGQAAGAAASAAVPEVGGMES